MEKTIRLKTKYVDENVVLKRRVYQNGTTAIQAYSKEDMEPVAVLTVALEDAKPNEGCVFLKGWSENEGVPEALVKEGVVELTGRDAATGFVVAQEAKLLIDLE